VQDPYYDPLLEFAGWRQVDEIDYGAITIWSKEGVPPATPMNQALMPPRWQGVLWGTLPFGSSILAILLAVLIPDRRRREFDEETTITPISQGTLVSGRMVS